MVQEEVNCLYLQTLIACTENTMGFTKKFPRLIYEFSKVAGYKVNIQNIIVSIFLSTKNKQG